MNNEKSNSYLSRFSLGSAQFGFDYGVTNHQGIVPPSTVAMILKFATSKGIDTIDTASMYGSSEEVLGQCDSSHFKLITKFSLRPTDLQMTTIEKHVTKTLEISLARLKLTSLEGLLAHDVNEFLEHREEILKLADKFKAEGKIKKFGISLYRPEQALQVMQVFTPDIIQFPMNIFDQRFITSGVLEKMAKRGIETHVRSAFLQGIILQKSQGLDPFFDFFKPLYTDYEEFIQGHNLSHIGASLKFLLDHPLINKILVGICSLQQIQEIASEVEKISATVIDFESWNFQDERLINPLSWPMLKK